jgi:hypothetical protein
MGRNKIYSEFMNILYEREKEGEVLNNKIRECVSRKEIERGLNLKPGIREKPIRTITQGGGEMQNSCRSEIEMQREKSERHERRNALSCEPP